MCQPALLWRVLAAIRAPLVYRGECGVACGSAGLRAAGLRAAVGCRAPGAGVPPGAVLGLCVVRCGAGPRTACGWAAVGCRVPSVDAQPLVGA